MKNLARFLVGYREEVETKFPGKSEAACALVSAAWDESADNEANILPSKAVLTQLVARHPELQDKLSDL